MLEVLASIPRTTTKKCVYSQLWQLLLQRLRQEELRKIGHMANFRIARLQRETVSRKQNNDGKVKERKEFHFLPKPQVASASLELTMRLRMTLNF